jgi:replicative DNA helicase
MSIEQTIISNLTKNEEYSRKVIPYLEKTLFSDNTERLVYEVIDNHIKTFNALPSNEALVIDLGNRTDVNDSLHSAAIEYIDKLNVDENTNFEWLLKNTEEWVQEKAIYNAIMDSIQIIDGKANGEKDKGSIPQLLSDALGVSFDNHVGHDFIEDASERFDFYQKKESRLPFDIDYLNKITRGGIPNKTLNIALAGTGVGKSLFMCHCASANLLNSKNVLYITLEMAEEKIAERIDANLLNVTMEELYMLPKEAFDKKIDRIASKTKGKLVIKEYPTASAGAGHFRHLLNELKLKRNFIPNVIYIDYLNICMSSRLRAGANVNSYTYIKAIAEELRGLAVEFNVPIFSATQTTRQGFGASDVGLEDTSESFGLPATADFMFALISTEELQDLNQIMCKQLKNRYADPNINKRFVIGIDKSKMRLYDVEQDAQQDIIEGPVFDNTQMGKAMDKPAELFKDFT